VSENAAKAGRAAMAKLTPEQRTAFAKKGARARWKKARQAAADGKGDQS